MAEIKTSAFCGLSRSDDWQNWLKVVASDLHQDLLSVVSAGKGCRANTNKMMDIYFELNKRGLEPQLITFLKRRFPWIVKDTEQVQPQRVLKPIAKKTQLVEQQPRDWNALNKHNVFMLYRPDILSFPQKLIIVDEPALIYGRVQAFIKNKLAVDYIIVENYAYIEYFDAKYAAVIDKIPRTARDIYKYRLKMQQNVE